MGIVFAAGGWLRFPDEKSFATWKKRKLRPEAFSDFPDHLTTDGLTGTVAAVLKLLDRDSQVLLRIDGTLLQIAAELDEDDGLHTSLPSLLLAMREAAPVGGHGQAWVLVADSGGVSELTIAAKGSAFCELDDNARNKALREPELDAAVKVCARKLDNLDSLPARVGKKAPSLPKTAPPPKARAPKEKWKWSVSKIGKSTMRGVAVDAIGALWAVGEKGAIARRKTKIDKWQKIDWASKARLTGIAIARDVIWIASQDGLLRGDASGSFAPVPSVSGGVQGVVAHGDRVLAMSGSEVWLSEDAGNTWRSVKTGCEDLQRIFGVGRAYAVVGFGGALSVSLDGGRTFRPRQAGTDTALLGVWHDGKRIYAGGMTSLVSGALEGDSPLRRVGLPMNRDASYCGIHGFGETVFVANWDEILRSQDGGATWDVVRKVGRYGELLALRASSANEVLGVGAWGACVEGESS